MAKGNVVQSEGLSSEDKALLIPENIKYGVTINGVPGALNDYKSGSWFPGYNLGYISERFLTTANIAAIDTGTPSSNSAIANKSVVDSDNNLYIISRISRKIIKLNMSTSTNLWTNTSLTSVQFSPYVSTDCIFLYNGELIIIYKNELNVTRIIKINPENGENISIQFISNSISTIESRIVDGYIYLLDANNIYKYNYNTLVLEKSYKLSIFSNANASAFDIYNGKIIIGGRSTSDSQTMIYILNYNLDLLYSFGLSVIQQTRGTTINNICMNENMVAIFGQEFIVVYNTNSYSQLYRRDISNSYCLGILYKNLLIASNGQIWITDMRDPLLNNKQITTPSVRLSDMLYNTYNDNIICLSIDTKILGLKVERKLI